MVEIADTRRGFPDQPRKKNVERVLNADKIHHTLRAVSDRSALSQGFISNVYRGRDSRLDDPPKWSVDFPRRMVLVPYGEFPSRNDSGFLFLLRLLKLCHALVHGSDRVHC